MLTKSDIEFLTRWFEEVYWDICLAVMATTLLKDKLVYLQSQTSELSEKQQDLFYNCCAALVFLNGAEECMVKIRDACEIDAM